MHYFDKMVLRRQVVTSMIRGKIAMPKSNRAARKDEHGRVKSGVGIVQLKAA